MARTAKPGPEGRALDLSALTTMNNRVGNDVTMPDRQKARVRELIHALWSALSAPPEAWLETPKKKKNASGKHA